MGSFLNRKFRPQGSKPTRSRLKSRPYHSLDTRRGLIDGNDQVVSLITRKREPACICCGSTENLTNGHLFSRRHHATRWDVTADGNCHTQCWNCNFNHIGNPDPYTFAFVREFGAEAHARVRDRAFGGQRFTTPELREMFDANRELLRSMN